mmetsp:Transcript_23543/g.38963  ORF Transcript_23543/g.38963 Transcript_23543/m.38963 type:complete len:94 (+) Transcript_23543:746-1027(+)
MSHHCDNTFQLLFATTTTFGIHCTKPSQTSCKQHQATLLYTYTNFYLLGYNDFESNEHTYTNKQTNKQTLCTNKQTNAVVLENTHTRTPLPFL